MKTIQVRNVPPALHKRLRERAVAAGLSLSDYVLGELTKLAARMTPEEFERRIALRETPEGRIDSVQLVRRERAGR